MSKNYQFWLFTTILALCLCIPVQAAKEPKAKVVKVNCADGDSITEALATQANELVIEIQGVCDEDVIVHRDNVTLRGTDRNQDGIRGVGPGDIGGHSVLWVRDVTNFTIENLKIVGGERNGLSITDTPQAVVTNCLFEDNHNLAISVTTSQVWMTDTAVASGGRGGIASHSRLSCLRCSVNVEIYAYIGYGMNAEDSSFNGEYFVSQDGYTHVANSTIQAFVYVDYGYLFLRDSTLQGSLWVEGKGMLTTQDVTQTINPYAENHVHGDAWLGLYGSSTLLGPTYIGGFAQMVQGADSWHTGDLICYAGGDVYCADPANMSGNVYDCSSCVKDGGVERPLGAFEKPDLPKERVIEIPEW